MRDVAVMSLAADSGAEALGDTSPIWIVEALRVVKAENANPPRPSECCV